MSLREEVYKTEISSRINRAGLDVIPLESSFESRNRKVARHIGVEQWSHYTERLREINIRSQLDETILFVYL